MAIVLLGANETNTDLEADTQAFALATASPGEQHAIFVCTTDGPTVSPAHDINTPSGWTKSVDIQAGDNSAVRLTCFLKIDAGETSVDITVGDGTPTFSCYGVALAFSGADLTPDDTDFTVSDSTTDITCPSVITTVENTHIIYAYCQDGSAASDPAWTEDAGFNGTARGFVVGGGGASNNGACVGVSSEAQVAIGASNTCVMNMDATEGACAMTIALAPSASAGINTIIIVPTGPPLS